MSYNKNKAITETPIIEESKVTIKGEKEKKGRVWRKRLAGGPDLWAPQNVGEGLCLTKPQPALH